MTSASEQNQPLSWTERFLVWVSEWRVVDRFTIGTLPHDEANELLQRVEDSLDTIRLYDPRRYQRLHQYLERIWVKVQVGGNTGRYNNRLRACELDPRLLLRPGIQPTDVASVIVHESTHARLQRFGFTEPLRSRIEALCRKQERMFSERLPSVEGDRIREKLRHMDEVHDDFWSDANDSQRYEASADASLQYMGLPRWLLPLSRLARVLARLIARARAA
jgi:hypothetical protein